MKLFGKSVSETLTLTPLCGGQAEGPVCSLLEIGEFCLLLDCGSSSYSVDKSLYKRVHHLISSKNKNLDAVVISHADHYHMGSLPVVLGKQGFSGTPVICTLPVYKFGQMLLYDTFLSRDMEGIVQPSKDGSNNVLLEDLHYDLDDVDDCMAHVNAVRFLQPVHLQSVEGTRTLTLTAKRSGRTIGGAIWIIEYGESTIIYAMDTNLKKELVLDGLSLDQLPMTPTLLITDAGLSSLVVSAPALTGMRRKKEQVGLAASVLIPAIMETVRQEGHVLLPCESAGRALELMQLLGSHWTSNNMGLYNLIFLTPMAHNILEFCKSQLEWMSESISKSFYNGKPNPFDLPYLRICTSVREMDKSYTGPKVVIATDSSLVHGCAKELLLKWGGDPRCRIIFTDTSDAGSLSYILRSQVPPIFATITKPLRIELTGDELASFRTEQAEKRRKIEEDALKRKREAEFEMLSKAGEAAADEGKSDDEAEDDSGNSNSGGIGNREDLLSSAAGTARLGGGDSRPAQLASSPRSPRIARSSSSASAAANDTADAAGAAHPLSTKKRKLQTSLISKFIQPNFVKFESNVIEHVVDEFGAPIDDLKFQDVTSVPLQKLNRDKSLNLKVSSQQSQRLSAEADAVAYSTDVPSKLIATPMKVQLTCGIKEVNLSGRIDAKGVRTIVSKVNPAKVVILRGSLENSNALAKQIQGAVATIKTFVPKNNESVTLLAGGDRVKLQVQSDVIANELVVVKGANSSSLPVDLGGHSSADAVTAVVVPVHGVVSEVESASRGTRIVRLNNQLLRGSNPEPSTHSLDRLMTSAGNRMSEVTAALLPYSSRAQVMLADASSAPQRRASSAAHIEFKGAISIGEVMLSSLKQKLEGRGINVEFRLGVVGGGMLVCAQQVIVKKGTDNDFILEGPPVPTYYAVRKVLYEHFAFI